MYFISCNLFIIGNKESPVIRRGSLQLTTYETGSSHLLAEGALSFTPDRGNRYSKYTKMVGFVQKNSDFFIFFHQRRESGPRLFDLNYYL